MNRFIIAVCICALLSTTYVMYSIDRVKTTGTYSQMQVRAVPEPVFEPEPIQPVLTADNIGEISCLQKNLFFEARNQSRDAQVAVAWVTINRVLNPKYPESLCGVVYQGRHAKNGMPIRHACKFSWYCDGLSDEPNKENTIERRAWNQAHTLATMMVKGCLVRFTGANCPPDLTHGAVFYHNPSTSSPKWAKVKRQTAQVGDHTFYAMN